MLVIAHRGASFELPENTLAAFERAIEIGADYVEIDVRADAAGELVVVHDRPRPGVPYPKLAEALDLMHGRIGVMVELKTPARYRRFDVVARTVRMLGADDVLVCFQRPPLVEARALQPGLRTVQHVGRVEMRYRVREPRAVNDPQRMAELAALGAGGIFTDRPELALPLSRAAARP